MESINQYGRSASEIAAIITEMNPNIREVSPISVVESQSRLETKNAIEALHNKIEDGHIEDGTYESKGVRFTRNAHQPNKNSIAGTKKGSQHWLNTNAKFFQS